MATTAQARKPRLWEGKKKLQKAPIQNQYFQKGHIEVFFPKPKAQRLSLNFKNLGS